MTVGITWHLFWFDGAERKKFGGQGFSNGYPSLDFHGPEFT
jgi:hypothetical protein